MAAEFEDTPETSGGVGILSTLLLSVLLKLEDRGYRVRARQLPGSTPVEVEDSPPSKDEMPEPERSRPQCGARDGDSLIDVDPLRSHHGEGALVSGTLLSPSSSTCLRLPNEDKDAIHVSTRPREQEDDGMSQDILLTSQSGCGDTPRRSMSPYQDSAVDIIAEALLRALANVFVSGIVRRGYRAFEHVSLPICEESWSVSTNVCNGNENQDSTSDEENSQDLQTTDGLLVTQIEERIKSNSPKMSSVLPNWLEDVNKRIASSKITVHRDDLVPPSVASSSCDLSRCSSFSVLSSVDRVLKVKATHPAQSKLLWRMVQKAHDANGASLEKLSEETAEKSSCKSEGEQLWIVSGPPDVSSDQEEEKAMLRASLLDCRQKSLYSEKLTSESVPCESAVLLGDSAARKQKKPCDQSVVHSETDDLTLNTQSTIDEWKPCMTNEFLQPTTTMTLPPSTSSLRTAVIWRHASDSNVLGKEAESVTRSGKGSRERKEACGMVKSALLHAVSSLVVNEVISGSVTSLSSADSFELRCTPSFKKAVANLPKTSLQGFQWSPYQGELPKGPCKPSRLGEDESQELPHLPQLVEKQQQNSESSDTYEDARDKFGSSDDLQVDEVNDHDLCSDDDEFGNGETCQKPQVYDRHLQVTQTDMEEIFEESVVVELPLESITFIKDQFEGAKALAAVYRDLLYKPPLTGETETPASSETKADNICHEKMTPKVVKGKYPKKKPSSETDMPRSSTSSILQKTATPPWPDPDSIESVYEDSFSEVWKATTNPKPRPRKRPSKGKKSYASQRRVKARPPRKLRKRAEATPRTPPGRIGVVASKNQTTPDGFLPALYGEQDRKSTERTTPVELSKNPEENASPLKETGDISLEDKPKVKSYISFFEKLSRHKITAKNDASNSTDDGAKAKTSTNSKKTEITTANRPARPRISSPKHGSDADGRGHAETIVHNKSHIKQDDGGKDGRIAKKESAEAGVDDTPGRGIWANAAFFEALSKVEGPPIATGRSPSMMNLEDGILNVNLDNRDGDQVEMKQLNPGVKAEDVTRSQPRKRVLQQTIARRRTSSEKRRSRNKNANNQMLLDQLLSSDGSSVSNSPCCKVGDGDKDESFTYALDKRPFSEGNYELQVAKTIENARPKNTLDYDEEFPPAQTTHGDQELVSLDPMCIAEKSGSGSSVKEDESLDVRPDVEKTKTVRRDVISTADKASVDETIVAIYDDQEDVSKSSTVRLRQSYQDGKETCGFLVEEPVANKDVRDQDESDSDSDQQSFPERASNEQEHDVDVCVESENAKIEGDLLRDHSSKKDKMEKKEMELSLQLECKADKIIDQNRSAEQMDEYQNVSPCVGPDKGENKHDMSQDNLLKHCNDEEPKQTMAKCSKIEQGQDEIDEDGASREIDLSRTPENSGDESCLDQEELTKQGDEGKARQSANPSEEPGNSEPLFPTSDDGTQPGHPKIRLAVSAETRLDLMSSMIAGDEEKQHRFDIDGEGFCSPPEKNLDDICSLELLNDPLLACSRRREASSPNSDEAGVDLDFPSELAISVKSWTEHRPRLGFDTSHSRRFGGKLPVKLNSLDMECDRSISQEDNQKRDSIGQIDAFVGGQGEDGELKTVTSPKDSTHKDTSVRDRTAATGETYPQTDEKGAGKQPETVKDKKRRWRLKFSFGRKKSQKKANSTPYRLQEAGRLQNQNIGAPDGEQQISLDTASTAADDDDDRAVVVATKTGTSGNEEIHVSLSNSPSPPACSPRRKFMLGRLKRQHKQATV